MQQRQDNRFTYGGISANEMYRVLHKEEGSPRVVGVVYQHRLACARYIRTELWQLLDDPALTRGKLRQELDRLCKQVEEHGPPIQP